MKLSSLILGKPKQSTEVTKDEWASQHRVYPENNGYKLEGWRDRDRLYDQACRRADTWSWAAKFFAGTTAICMAWGIYGTTRPDIITKYELIDRMTGEKIAAVKGTTTIPDVMMQAEMRGLISRCAFSLSGDEVVEKECASYRYRTFVDDAAQTLQAWREAAGKRSDLRIAQFMGANQSDKDKNMWTAEFEVREYSAKNLTRQYRIVTNIRFDYTQPIFGFWLDDESGFRISYMPINEKRGV